MRVGELAQQLGGRLLGEDSHVHAVCSLESAQKGDLAALLHPKELKSAFTTQASCMLLDESYAAQYADRMSCSLIALENPFLGFARALRALHPDSTHPAEEGMHTSCVVHPQAQLGQGVYAGPLCCIGRGIYWGSHACVAFCFCG